MAGSLLPEPKQQFLNDIGDPLFAGQIFTYAAGTLTPKTTYQDQALTIENTNPVVANARGEVVMYGSGTYRVILKDYFGNTIYDRDNIDTPDVGFLSFKNELSSSIGATLIGWISSAVSAVYRTVQDKLKDQTCLFDFMTPAQISDVRAGTKSLNVGLAVQAAWDWCTPRGIAMLVPAGVYRIDAPLLKPGSFSAPIMIGENGESSVFDFSNVAAGESCVYIQGGSGRLTTVVWRGVGFKGSGTQIAIEVDGQCGMTFDHLVFSDLAGGFLFHNKTPGAFGEYLIGESCEFKVTCLKPLEYRRSGSGDASFHGSGLRNCLVNGATGYPVVTVGDGCFPYNSPLSLQLWPQFGPVTLVQHNGTSPTVPAIFHGTVTLEPNASWGVVLGAGTGVILMSSSITAVNNNWSPGTARLCEHISLSGDGQLSLLRRPYTSSATPVVNGGGVNADLNFNKNAGVTTGMLLHITARGANYRWSTLGIATMDSGQGGGNTFVKICDTAQFNASGWGAPTYALDGNGFVVVFNAAGGFSVTIDIAVSQIGYNIG